MYLLVLAFTFFNCYFFIILFLHLLSFFTYYAYIPFINEINKIFKLPYFFKISCENLFYKETKETEETELYSSDDEIKLCNKVEDNKLSNTEVEKNNNLSDNNLDDDTEDEEIDKKLRDIEDFIEIRKNKFLINESLD
jgi:hypothetical protein